MRIVFKRKMGRKVWGIAAAAVLILNQASATFAKTYDVQMGDVDLSTEDCILYPEDVICGLDLPVYYDGDYSQEAQLGENGSWTNKQVQELKNRAYRVSLTTNEETGEAWYDITKEGYLLTLTNAESRYLDPELEKEADNHYEPEDTSREPDVRQDRAYYETGDIVAIDALPSKDGLKEFGGFTVESANVDILQDPATGSYYIVMPDQEVRISVNYVDPMPEPQPEAVPEQQPEPEPQPEAVPDQLPEQEPAQDTAGAYVEEIQDLGEGLMSQEPAQESWDQDQAEGGSIFQENDPDVQVWQDGQQVDLWQENPEQAPVSDAADQPQQTSGADQSQPASGSFAEGLDSQNSDQSDHTSIFDSMDESAIGVFGQDSYSDQDEDWDYEDWEDVISLTEAATEESTEEATEEETEEKEEAADKADSDNADSDKAVSVDADAESSEKQDVEIASVAGLDGIVLEGSKKASGTNEEVKEELVPAQEDPEKQTEAPEKQTEAPEKQTEAPEKQTEAPEKQTEAPEKQTEAPEKQTEAPEKQTEAPEKQTEAPEKQTEAPEKQTEAPEKQTEAPEKQTEAPEKQTEAPEKQTEAPEKQTEAPEKQTEAPEKQTEEKEPAYYAVKIDLSDKITITDKDGNPVDLTKVKEGTTLNLKADTSDSGKRFESWKISGAGTVKDKTASSTTFTVGSGDVTISASYLKISRVVVKKGSGSGTYVEKDQIDISADTPEPGKRFKQWKVVVGDAVLDDPYSAKTFFTMPASTVKVKALYETISYTLTVNNGTGDGDYSSAATVSIAADWPATGKEFDKWVIESGDPTIQGADRYNASVTMPEADVTVKAVYKDGPSPDFNAIQGITAGGEYLKGTTITFTAVGNGMDNANPNPGDYHYKPTGYQIGNVSGGWSDNSFQTSMAINAVGEYTLTVTFTKEVYNGSNWVSDGTTDTKAVTFKVVNALSVETFDPTPTELFIGIAGAALIAIIIAVILLVHFRKKRNR